jgi:RimJ/RimL family protein N-acetyltransferase
MKGARSYRAEETLRNGLVICIRALQPDDGERMAEAFSKLDPDSVYTRFFTYKKEVTEEDFQLIREMDFDLRVALIATLMQDGREIVIASSSFSVFGQDEAEVAFIVEEDYHGLGIARRLLMHLGRIARERGIKRFRAEVLNQNSAMLRVFAGSGWPMESVAEDGSAHVTLFIDRPASI